MHAAVRALGRLPTGTMNNLEKAYDAFLKADATVVWHAFESIKLRLADGCFYTPDFLVMLTTGELEAREVKGHWQEDARVKIKVAASKFPIRFIAVKPRAKRDGGGWSIEEF